MKTETEIERREQNVIKYIQKTRYDLKDCVSTLQKVLNITEAEIWYIMSISARKKIIENERRKTNQAPMD